MEAVPRLPMYSFELKSSPENITFGSKLKQYIAEAYREDPESYSNDIHQLESLRSAAVRPTNDIAGCAALKRYFCQLRALETRFPMAKGEPAAITFTWRELFSGMPISVADIRVELASVLYNAAALHAQVGAAESRVSADSMKSAVTHFQTAAWLFTYLREHFPQPPGCDLAADVLRLMHEICLAQGQECILEKSLTDNKKPTVIGAVGMQVVMYYKNCLTLLGPSSGQDTLHETMGSKVYTNYSKYFNFKIAYYQCIVYLHTGMSAEEQQKMGERVAYYQAAQDMLQAAKKLSKGMSNIEAINEAFTFTNDVVEGKRKAAKNENEFIYHEEVLAKELLTDPKPAPVVRDLPVDFNDPEVSGPLVFARLVPLGAHEVSSVYSEEKAKLLRRICGEAEKKNEQLTEFLSSLQLEQLGSLERGSGTLPQALVDRCAALAAKPTLPADLAAVMNELAGLREDAHSTLTSIHGMLEEEDDECRAAQRTPSLMLADLQREFTKYSDAHTKADESNQVLHKAMTLHLANLKVLAQPLDVLGDKIPSPDKLEIDRSGLIEMRRVADKADEMQKQRDSLLADLRATFAADDITPRLLSASVSVGSRDQSVLFAKELHKHAPKMDIIRQNFSAQENIIKRLTELYAQQADNRRTLADTVKKREALIAALITSYDAYEDLLGKARKGVDFYKKLLSNVNQLSARVRSVCQVNQEERQQLRAATKNDTKSYNVASKQVRNENEDSSSSSPAPPPPTAPSAPKLKDYLPYMRNRIAAVQPQLPVDMTYLPAVRPAPLGSEGTNDTPYSQINDREYYKGSQSYPLSNVPSAQFMGPGQTTDGLYAPPTSYNSSYKYQTDDQFNQSTNIPQYADNAPYNQQVYGYDQNSTYGQLDMVPQNSSSVPQSYHVSTPAHYSSYDQNTGQTMENHMPHVQSYPQSAIANPMPQNEDPSYSQQYYRDTSDRSGNTTSQPALSASTYNNTGSYIQSQMGQMQISDPQYSTPSYPQYPSESVPYSSNPQYPSESVPYSSAYQQPYATNYVSVPQVSEMSMAPSVAPFVDPMSTNVATQYYPHPVSEQTVDASFPQNNNMSNYNTTTSNFSMQPGVNSYTVPNTSMGDAVVGKQILQDDASGYAYNASDMSIGQNQAINTYNSQPVGQEAFQTLITNQYPTQMQTFDTSNDSPPDQSVISYQGFPVNSQPVGELQTHIPSNSEGANQNAMGQSIQENHHKSYENHPGYGYSAVSGIYEYSSGYQNSNSYQQVDPNAHDGSIYSNAGNHDTAETSSADQSTNMEPSSSKYYSVQYGQQNVGNELGVEMNANVDSTQQTPTYVSSGNVNTSVTYTSKEDTQTNTSTVAKTEPSMDIPPVVKDEEPDQSNIDLLAGLDFSVDLPTLTPQIKVPSVSESSIRKLPTSSAPMTSTSKALEVHTNTIGSIVRSAKRDIFLDPGLVNKFTQEVKRLQIFVDSLSNKTSDGITILDAKWKEIQQLQHEKCAKKLTNIVSSHEGDQGVLASVVPYDDTRVILEGNPYAYLNASYIKQMSSWCPPLILSSIPKETDYFNFWSMVVQHEVAVIVCLLTEIELQGTLYWPTVKGQVMQIANDLKVTLQESNCTVHWTERVLIVERAGKQHQLTHFHINVFPAKVVCSPLILLVDNILKICGFHNSNVVKSVVLQCDGAREGVSAGGRSALVSLVLMVVSQVHAGQVDLCDMLQNGCLSLCEARKNVLEDTKTLMDTYRTCLYYVQGVLCSGTAGFNGEIVAAQSAASTAPGNQASIAGGISASTNSGSTQQQLNVKAKKFSKESFEDMKQTAGLKSGDMKDPLSFLDPLWSLKKK